MWGHQREYWPANDLYFRPIVHQRYPRHSLLPYGGSIRRMPSINPLAHVEQNFPRVGILQTPFYDQKLYMDFSGPTKLDVQYKVNSVAAEVSWTQPLSAVAGQKFEYQVTIVGCTARTLDVPNWKQSIRLQVVPGTWYEVTVKAITPMKQVVSQGSVKFKSVLSRNEMLSLYDKAMKFLRTDMYRFEFFYRNKPKAYWNEMRRTTWPIMKTYLKDNNGHPASPINNEINGLFFSCNLINGQRFPDSSIYGDIRLYMPAFHLLNRDTNLYFADFYCNYSVHYVTIVLTLRGSECDRFCQRTLIQLNPTDNMFLSIRPNAYAPSGAEYWVNSNIWMEAYYTEDVDTSLGSFKQVVGKGQSKPNGLPNNKFCVICNLYPKIPTPEELEEIANGGRIVGGRVEKRSQSSDRDKIDSKRVKDDIKNKVDLKAGDHSKTALGAIMTEETSTAALVHKLVDELESELEAIALIAITSDVSSVLCQLIDDACAPYELADRLTPKRKNSNASETSEDGQIAALYGECQQLASGSYKMDRTKETLTDSCGGQSETTGELSSSQMAADFKPDSTADNLQSLLESDDQNIASDIVTIDEAAISDTASEEHNSFDENTSSLTCEAGDKTSSVELSNAAAAAKGTAVESTPKASVALEIASTICNNSNDSRIVSNDGVKASPEPTKKPDSPLSKPLPVGVDYVDSDGGEFSDKPQVSLRPVSEIVASLDDPFEREILGFGSAYPFAVSNSGGLYDDVDVANEDWILNGDFPPMAGYQKFLPSAAASGAATAKRRRSSEDSNKSIEKRRKHSSGSNGNNLVHVIVSSAASSSAIAQASAVILSTTTSAVKPDTPIGSSAVVPSTSCPKPQPVGPRKGFFSPPTKADVAKALVCEVASSSATFSPSIISPSTNAATVEDSAVASSTSPNSTASTAAACIARAKTSPITVLSNSSPSCPRQLLQDKFSPKQVGSAAQKFYSSTTHLYKKQEAAAPSPGPWRPVVTTYAVSSSSRGGNSRAFNGNATYGYGANLATPTYYNNHSNNQSRFSPYGTPNFTVNNSRSSNLIVLTTCSDEYASATDAKRPANAVDATGSKSGTATGSVQDVIKNLNARLTNCERQFIAKKD